MTIAVYTQALAAPLAIDSQYIRAFEAKYEAYDGLSLDHAGNIPIDRGNHGGGPRKLSKRSKNIK